MKSYAQINAAKKCLHRNNNAYSRPCFRIRNTRGKRSLCTKIMNFLWLCFITRQAKRFDKNKTMGVRENTEYIVTEWDDVMRANNNQFLYSKMIIHCYYTQVHDLKPAGWLIARLFTYCRTNSIDENTFPCCLRGAAESISNRFVPLWCRSGGALGKTYMRWTTGIF